MSRRSRERRLEAHREAARKQRVKPNPAEIITYKGWRMSRYTAAAIAVLQEKLGYELTLTQGPYNKGVGASAGTHDLDGVIDLSSWRSSQKVTVARRNSWAMWPRKDIPGVWSAHCHGVLKRAKPMASLAVHQLEVSYPNHTDGLASENYDSFPAHPTLERFDYNAWWHDQLLDQKIDGVSARINTYVDKLAAARREKKRLKAQKKKAA